jgi:DNA invertase Pin-like site-specific DNA recombinase
MATARLRTAAPAKKHRLIYPHPKPMNKFARNTTAITGSPLPPDKVALSKPYESVARADRDDPLVPAESKILKKLEKKFPILGTVIYASKKSTNKRRLRAAVYMRYSTKKQDEYSFTRQLDRAKAYAESINADIVKVFGDAGKSARFTANRANFRKMLAEARKGHFDLIIIEESDRIARKLSIATSTFEILNECGVELHSTGQGKWSLMHAAIFGLMSADQRARMSDLMRSGIIKIVKRGLWPMSAPYGYEKVAGSPGEMVVVEECREIIKDIYQRRLKGLGHYEIARQLRKENVPAPEGSLWTSHYVKRILLNPLYVGIIVFNKTKQTIRQIDEDTIETTVSDRPPEEWVCAERLDWQVVDLEDWQSVQVLENIPSDRGPKPQYLLSKLAHCARCGNRMRLHPCEGGRRFFCSTRNPSEKVYVESEMAISADPLAEKPKCDMPSVVAHDVEAALIKMVCERMNFPEAAKFINAGYLAKSKRLYAKLNGDRIRLLADRASLVEQLDYTFTTEGSRGVTVNILGERRANFCAKLEAIDADLIDKPEIVVPDDPLVIPKVDTADFEREFYPGRDLAHVSDELGTLVSIFRKLVGNIVLDMEKGSTKDVIVTVNGLIAHIRPDPTTAGEPRIEARFRTTLKRYVGEPRAREAWKSGAYFLSDKDWRKIKLKLPSDPPWICPYESPIPLRNLLDFILVCKHSGLSMKKFPLDILEDLDHWLKAVRMLEVYGVLRLAQQVMESEKIKLIEGVSLQFFGENTVQAYDEMLYARWNDIRKARIMKRLKRQQKAA